jgi:hypothetical protein
MVVRDTRVISHIVLLGNRSKRRGRKFQIARHDHRSRRALTKRIGDDENVESKETFSEHAKREREIAARLSPEAIDRLCSLDIHFKHVDATFKALGLD